MAILATYKDEIKIETTRKLSLCLTHGAYDERMGYLIKEGNTVLAQVIFPDSANICAPNPIQEEQLARALMGLIAEMATK